ncbi:MAG: transglutaminase domain-containing protein [Candidatus Fimenecus sp.]
MKKVSILLVAALLIWVAVLLNVTDIRMWIPTDFSEAEEDLAHIAEEEVRYYYEDLSTNGKIAYNGILSQIRSHPAEIEIPVLEEEEFRKMFQALSYDNPDLLCMRNESQIVKRGAKAYFVPQYTCDVETCNARSAELDTAVQEILRGIPAEGSTYAIELYLHDTICARLTYETQDSAVGYTAYDALVLGRAVCEGYARSMQLLLNCVGIPNYLVTGTGVNADGDTEGHMWNLVTVEGQNYYLDATWDDLDSVAIDRYSHAYFNVSDADIQGNHLEITPSTNQCIYEQYNYFVHAHLLFEEYNTAARARMADCIKKAMQNGETTFEIRFANSAIYEEAFSDLIEDGVIYDLALKADRSFFKKYSDILYVQDAQMLTIQFAFA